MIWASLRPLWTDCPMLEYPRRLFLTWFLTDHTYNFTPRGISIFHPCWVWSHYSPHHTTTILESKGQKSIHTQYAPEPGLYPKGKSKKERNATTQLFVAVFTLAHTPGSILQSLGRFSTDYGKSSTMMWCWVKKLKQVSEIKLYLYFDFKYVKSL